MKYIDLTERLSRKLGFIYEIDEEYYYIGQGIFKKCIQGSLDYDRYRKFQESVKNDSNDIEKDFKKVLAISKCEENIESKEKLKKFIEDLPQGERLQLKKQVDVFEQLFHRYHKNIVY